MRTTFYVLVGGFLLGVAIRSIYEVSIYTAGFLLLFVFSLLLLRFVNSFVQSGMYVALFCLVFLLGVIRTEHAYEEYENAKIFTQGEVFQGSGTVVAEVDRRDTYVVMKVSVLEKGTVLRVKLPPYPQYSYGDDVYLSGTIHIPEVFQTDRGTVFHYPRYLMKEGVHYEIKNVEIEHADTNSGNILTKKLLSIKAVWLESISSLLPEPEASLAGGVVVGAKQSLGEWWLELFRDTGIIHIVVLSGYNLTLVANAIIRMTARLPQTIRFFLGSVGIASFAVMVGGGATVVRASIMAFLGMLAGFMKRRYLLLRALLLAGFLMVSWNPFVLLFDAGFQLSFVATAGLILLAPYLEVLFIRITDLFALRAIVAATLATQVAVLPLLLFHIGVVSLVAPLVNILVLPIVPAVMMLGFAGGAVGMFSQVLAVPFAFVTHLLLSYIFFVVQAFSKLPYAAVELPPVPWWLIVSTYFIAVVLLITQYKKPLTQR